MIALGFFLNLDLLVSFLHVFTQFHLYVPVEISAKKFDKLHMLTRDEIAGMSQTHTN